jgi:hypothetical protein
MFITKLGYYCDGIVQMLLVMLLDISQGPLSIAMAMGICIVIVVVLVTSLITSSNCYLA